MKSLWYQRMATEMKHTHKYTQGHHLMNIQIKVNAGITDMSLECNDTWWQVGGQLPWLWWLAWLWWRWVWWSGLVGAAAAYRSTHDIWLMWAPWYGGHASSGPQNGHCWQKPCHILCRAENVAGYAGTFQTRSREVLGTADRQWCAWHQHHS